MSSALRDYQATTTSILDADQTNRRLLYIFTALAGLVAVQIMHLALDDLKVNAGLTGGLICGFIYSYLLAPRFRAMTTYAISAVSVVIAMAYYLEIRADETMLGTYLAILAGILMVLLAFKAFAPADHRFILMFSVVFLLFSSVASYDLKFMLLLPLFLVFAGCSLYLANQIDVSVRVAGTAGQQYQLRLGFGQGFAGVLARAVAGIILLASVAYVIVPHSAGSHNARFINSAPKVDRAEEGAAREQQKPATGSAGETAEIGLSTDFDLRDSRPLESDPRPVLKVRSHRVGYLRAQVFDVYTGSGWERSDYLDRRSLQSLATEHNAYLGGLEDDNSFNVPLVDFPGESYAESLAQKQGIQVVKGNVFSTAEGDLDYDIVRQEVVLLEEQLPFYFSTYQPFKLTDVSLERNTGRMLTRQPFVDGASVLRPYRLTDKHPKDFSYVVYALEPRVSAAQLEQVVGKPAESILRQYTQLPLAAMPLPEQLGGLNIEREAYRPLSQRLKTFAKRFDAAGPGDAGAINAWSTVKSIVDYLTNENEFTYSRQFDPIAGEQEITEAFVLGTQEGYCRYFASAMAVLCRLNNIPARLVTGYSPGTYSLVDNAYIYKASNAHVWCEVYFNGYGWITFDPSPTGADLTDTGGALQWLNSTLNFLQELFVLDPASTRETILQSLSAAWAWALAHGRLSLLVLGGVLLVIALYLIATRVRLRRRKPRLRPQNEVVAAYLRLRGVLTRAGVRPGPRSTVRTLLGAASLRYPQLSEQLAEFIPVYEAAAFSPKSVTAEDVARARQVVAQVDQVTLDTTRRKQR